MNRTTIPGLPHHVTQRGNRRQDTFYSRHDFAIYLKLLETAAKAHEFEVWSYCLMTNHVHLLVVPHKEDSLSNGIGQVHHAYTTYLNRKKGWKGHLWQGRFFSNVVQLDRAAIVAKYIELNPIRAGICSKPWDYLWSSATSNCGFSRHEITLNSPISSQTSNWAEFLMNGIGHETEIAQIRETARTGRVYGSHSFISELEQKTGQRLQYLKRGRPYKGVLNNSNQSGGTN